MTTHQYANRMFQLWEYRVSHGSLLIRSPQGPDSRKNVDILCAGVEYLATPRFLRGLEIVEPTLEELQSLEKKLGKSLSVSTVRIFASSGQRFPVVASSFKLEENERDIFDSPFDD